MERQSTQEPVEDTLEGLFPAPTLTAPPLSASPTLSFSHNNKSYRSIGTFFSPETAAEEEAKKSKKAEEPVELKEDAFKVLARETVVRVLEWVVELQVAEARKALEESDSRRTGWLSTDRMHHFAELRKQRYRALKTLQGVSRSWYHISLPWLWTHLDFSGTTYSQGIMNALAEHLSRSSTIPPALLIPKLVATSTTSNDSQAPPLAPIFTRLATAQTETTTTTPTFGSLVKTFTTGNDSCTTTFLISLLPHLPNLSSIIFLSQKLLRNPELETLALAASPSLRSLDRISFNSTEDTSTRLERLLKLFNRAPNLEHFGAQGLVVSEPYAKRLAFVWQLNARLKHEKSGALGEGLKELYLGPGTSMPVSFLRGLDESMPRLSTLHIKTGVSIVADSSAQGQQPFDLRGFAMHWGKQLTALTIVGTIHFSTRGKFDDILKLCPNLVTLHLRSDHITWDFFHSLVELAKSSPLQESTTSTDSDSPLALVQTPSCDIDLATPLQVLLLQYRLPVGDSTTIKGNQHGSYLCRRLRIVPFARCCLEIEAKGLEWPNDMGGQRDVIDRAGWMLGRMVRREEEEGGRREVLLLPGPGVEVEDSDED